MANSAPAICVMINVLRRPTARNMLGEFRGWTLMSPAAKHGRPSSAPIDAQHEVFVAASGEPIAL